MVLAWILISLPFTGLRPARASAGARQKRAEADHGDALAFATFATIASNTAFTASLAATLLTFPLLPRPGRDRLGDHVWHAPPALYPSTREHHPNRNRNTTLGDIAHARNKHL